MKRFLSLGLVACFLSVFMAGCNNTASSAVASSAVQASSSVAPSSSIAASSASTVAEAASLDVDGMLATLTEAAGLGATISMSELDLKAIGLNTDNIVAWAGAQSQLVAQNGGTVIVIEAKPGTEQDMKAAFEKYRDLLANDDRYQDYTEALKNISEARIVVNENCVIYAVSALGQEGGYDTLDAALNGLFA